MTDISTSRSNSRKRLSHKRPGKSKVEFDEGLKILQSPALKDLANISEPLRARVAALVLMLEVQQGRSLQHRLDGVLKKLPPQDRGFTMEILMGSLRYFIPLKIRVKSCLQKPLKAQQAWLESLLIMGTYQLVAMEVPAHAAIHSTVEVVRLLGLNHLTGLTNGVLRNIHRQLPAETSESAPPFQQQQLAIHDYLNNGNWLHESLYKNWREQFLSLMAQGQQQPPIVLRVNQLKISAPAYAERLAAEQITTLSLTDEPLPLPHALELTVSQNVALLPGFELGWFSVQDSSAQAAVKIFLDELKNGITPLDALPENETQRQLEKPFIILDACAAPGGKTAALLEALPKQVQLDVLDVDKERLAKVQENLERLDLLRIGVTLQCADFTTIDAVKDLGRAEACYDAILLDAPCSGTGVLARHPDIFWCRREDDIANLVQTQRQMLQRAEALLKPGGLLLYTTCSILKAENSDNIKWHLESTGSKLLPVDIDDHVARALGESQEYGIQRLPLPNAKGDGFYYALMRKQA